MADTCIECDVAIVGSGFAGSLIANELSQEAHRYPQWKRRLNVVILEAGPGVQPNINDYMRSFYKASAKVPESPYPPALVQCSIRRRRRQANVAHGRPTGRILSKAYLDQKDEHASLQEHLRASCRRHIALDGPHTEARAERFPHEDEVQRRFPDWPINYETMSHYYEKAEAELGVAGDVADHSFAGLTFSPGYAYPMPRIPPSLFDQHVNETLAHLTDDETKSRFLGTAAPVTSLTVRSQPAARNSQPYKNCRACAGNTSCIPICPIQAKYDPTITLNEATNNGAKLMDHTVASEILVDANNRVSGINFITYKDEAGPKTGSGCIKAKIYIIAANGIETPRLLLMSNNQGRTPNGVANSRAAWSDAT